MQTHTDYAIHLFDTGLFSDCTIYCRNQTWHLHRSTLAQRCSFFRACFSSSFRESLPNTETGIIEVSMHEDEPEALERMLKWLYTLQYPCLSHAINGNRTNCQALTKSEGYDKTDGTKEFAIPSRKASSESILRDEGYLSDGSVSDACHQQSTTDVVSEQFWTSELRLLAVSEKYDLSDLAAQASESICRAAETSLGSFDTSTPCVATTASLENFVAMLQELYTDFCSTSKVIRQLQESLISRSAMVIAAYVRQQPRFQDLIETTPGFAIDLVEALRCQVESNANKVKHSGGIDQLPQSLSSCCKSSSGSSSVGSSGSSADSALQTQSRSPGQSRRRVYIPMNEDSDLD